MRKALACMGIGGPYEAQLVASRPFRKAYADRHGWDLVDITEIDPRANALTEYKMALRCHLQKLLIPATLADKYDLVLFVEADTVLHPDAPCISSYAPYLPPAGFGAVCDHIHQEREGVFGWVGDHYDYIASSRHDGAKDFPPVTNRAVAMNGGVELYRPGEVAQRWLELFRNNAGHSDENLLNLYEVQQNRVFWLPSEWNRIWLYEKVRIRINASGSNLYAKVRNRLYNRYLFKALPQVESRAFRAHFPTAHIHHLAQEGHKMMRLASAVADSLRPAKSLH